MNAFPSAGRYQTNQYQHLIVSPARFWNNRNGFFRSQLVGKGVSMSGKKTAIVTGAQQGIGAGLVEGFLKNGYNVVATSLNPPNRSMPHLAWFSSKATSRSKRRLPKLSRQP